MTAGVLLLLALLIGAPAAQAGGAATLSELIPGAKLADSDLAQLFGKGVSITTGGNAVTSGSSSVTSDRVPTRFGHRPRGGGIDFASDPGGASSRPAATRSPRATRRPRRPVFDIRLDPPRGRLAPSVGLGRAQAGRR